MEVLLKFFRGHHESASEIDGRGHGVGDGVGAQPLIYRF